MVLDRIPIRTYSRDHTLLWLCIAYGTPPEPLSKDCTSGFLQSTSYCCNLESSMLEYKTLYTALSTPGSCHRMRVGIYKDGEARI